MSRDFLIVCDNESLAEAAQRMLVGLKDQAGNLAFEVDNRGRDLFVTLVYDRDITDDVELRTQDVVIKDFKKHVAFVALKNGVHNGVGYFLDTGVPKNTLPPVFPLKDLADLIMAAV
jgi:hypothetical protein